MPHENESTVEIKVFFWEDRIEIKGRGKILIIELADLSVRQTSKSILETSNEKVVTP